MNPMFLTLGWQQFIENPIIILLSVGLFVITTVSCVTVIIYSRRRRQSLNEVMLEIEANSQAQSLPTTADDDDDDDDDVDHTDDTDTDNNIETATAPPPPTWADQIKTSLANTITTLITTRKYLNKTPGC